jgi:putative oxidoreductase
VPEFRTMPLHVRRSQKPLRVNRLSVNSGKSGGSRRLGYGDGKYRWRTVHGRHCRQHTPPRRQRFRRNGHGAAFRSACSNDTAALGPFGRLDCAAFAGGDGTLSTSRAISARAAERARRSRSVFGLTVDSFVSACAFMPYALVALALRLVMARLFFHDGQTRISGPRFSLSVYNFDFSGVLPLQVKTEAFGAFLTQYAAVPLPPVLGAYLVSYAEFILPIMLVLGLGTRFAALGLLIMMALIDVSVVPQAMWTAHIYWAAILMVLLSLGAGQISFDHVIRFIAKRG